MKTVTDSRQSQKGFFKHDLANSLTRLRLKAQLKLKQQLLKSQDGNRL
jgi:hypothetical protein